LRQSQRDWIRERRECWKASVGLDTCVANAYAFRIHALREGHAGARSDDGAGISRGPVAVRCDGMDALISAVFLNGTRSLVSLQWLDRGMVLVRVPSGSGGKYETETLDGGTTLLWVHGNEAMFSEPGGAEMTCVVEETG
jgi:membrane-bound inhibitor of C-type lysozyme